jgi:hypothetical protein
MDAASLAQCASLGPHAFPQSDLFNSMIAPYQLGPFSLAGFTWYQAEENANAMNFDFYACAYPSMVAQWRAAFDNPYAFFGAVQLAPFSQPGDWLGAVAPTRLAQLSGNALSNSVVVPALDLGDPTSPETNIHPRFKQPVGARLAGAALEVQYGLPAGTPYVAPTYARSIVADAGGDVLAVNVSFVPGSGLAGSLTLIPAPACPVAQGVLADQCGGFLLQLNDANGTWVPANATIAPDDATRLVITAAAPTVGLAPVATAYAWAAWPLVSLFNGVGTPAFPWNDTVTPICG